MSAPNPNEPNNTVAAPPPQSATDATGAPGARTASEFNLGAPMAAGEVGVLGPYRIVKELGKGGMGAVYLAIDTRLDRKLALKVMLPEFAANRDAKERFIREAKAVAKIGHDNVVTIYEADERDGVPYIAMQFLQGYPLDEFLKKKGAPPLAHCVRIGIEAARGLAAAHELGLVHRDIKPANLWLEAPNGRVKVLDFGLAKPVGTDTELTKSGVVVGTPAYMSPEQARGSTVDARTDIFSLGTVMYRLLTGKNPFGGANIMAVLMALGMEEPTPIRELNPSVPDALAAFVMRMLAKKPENRPQTATEVAQGLRAAMAQASPSADQSQALPVVVQPVPAEPSMHVTVAPESAFANLTDDEDEPTEAASAAPAAPVRREPRKGGKGPVLVVGAAVLLAAVAVAVLLGSRGNKPEDSAKEPDPVPPPKEKEKERPKPKPKASDLPPVPAREWKPVPAGASPFDKLDASAIPKNERFDWQPPELVAVIGSHARQHWRTLKHDNFAFSPDGKWAVTVGVNESLQEDGFALHEVATGKEVARVSGTQALGKLWGGATFARDGNALLLALEDGVSVGRHADGAWTFQRLNGVSKYHWPVVLADGKTLVVLANDSSGFELWDIDAERFRRRKTVERGGHVLGASADRKWLYLARDNAKDKPFELEAVALDRDDDTRKVVLTLPAGFTTKHVGGSTAGPAVCVSPDGTRFAALHKGGWDTDCSLYDLTATPPKELSRFALGELKEGCVQFSPDGKTLVRRYTAIFRTDVTANPPRALPHVSLPNDGGCAVSPDGKTLITNANGTVVYFDLSGEQPKELHRLTNALMPARPSWRDVFVAPARGLLGVNTFPTEVGDGIVSARLWDLTGAAPKPWPNDANSFTGPADGYLKGLTVNGAHALVNKPQSGGAQFHARVTATGLELPAEPYPPIFQTASDNGFALVPGAPPKLWHLDEPYEKAKPLPDLDTTNLQHFAVRDDRALATTVNGGVLTLWNTSGEKARAVFVPTEPTAAAFFTPDGKRLIAIGGGRVRVYDLTGRSVTDAPVQPNVSAAVWAAVTPDSRVAVFASGNSIRAIDLTTGADVWQTTLPGAPYWVRVAPDNRHLFAHNANGTVYVLRLSEALERNKPAVEAREPVGADWLDVLAQNDNGFLSATWAKRGGKWASQRVPSGPATIQLPLTATSSYELEAEVAFDLGREALSFHLPVGARTVQFGFGHWQGTRAGFYTINGAQWGNPTEVNYDVLPANRNMKVRIAVRIDGTDADLSAGVDGVPPVKWNGPLAQLARTQEAWAAIPADRFALSAWDTRYTVHALRFKKLDGTAEVVNRVRIDFAAERAAAEWALGTGAHVTITGAPDERVVTDTTDLPAGPFRLKNLQFRSPGDKATDADLARFKGLTALNNVHLSNAQVTDAGLAHFAGSTTIASLEWGGNPALTGTGLVHFAKCRGLQSIQFFGTPLSDAGLAHLKGMTKLTHANLSGTKLTDASAEVFESWPLLDHLNLGGVAVTDATLERLTKLDALRVLSLGKSGVTEAGVKKLAAALPLCKIDWDGGTVAPAKK